MSSRAPAWPSPAGSAPSADDGELDEPLPNAERLVAQAVALAGDDHQTASLVDRFWRFAPDEELVGYTAAGDARRRAGAPRAGRRSGCPAS